LTESPTLVNTKENGRLLISGGIFGYSSSNQVYQVDMCMNTLQKHSEMKIGRVGHAAVYINNKDIYVIGGYNADQNKWLRSVEVCYDAFAYVTAKKEEAVVPHWEMKAEMKEARYYFGCCTLKNEHIYVFGGMNDSFMLNELAYGQSKCLNSIERYSIEKDEWDLIELSTYQKFPYCSHIVAVNLPWDSDHILIVGGQTYNKDTNKFENMRMVYKFFPYEDKL
jgi:N-acetylneuraminic acid mutarotase